MKRLALLAALLALAGCSHVPKKAGPDAPLELPATWRTLLGPQIALQRDWWQSLGDPVLTQHVEAALANNLDVATAAARVAEARGQEEVARALLLPTLDLGVTATRAGTLNAFGKVSTATTVQPVFQAAYEVDLFGRIHDQVAAAAAGLRGAEAGRDAAALSVAAATASGYITLRALDARLRILRETVQSRGDAVRLARGRAEIGYTSDLEWRQAQAEYEATAQQLPTTQLAIERQEHAIALLTGLPPQDIARGRTLDQLMLPDIPEGLPSEVLRRRPDIAQAEQALAAADANLAVARAQFLPSVRLTGSAGQLFVSTLGGGPLNIWSLGASVLAPIFEGGRLEGQYDTAQARRMQAALAYRRAVLAALREVEDSLSTVARTREQKVRVQAQREVLAEVLRHAGNRYRAGYSSYLEQLDAERNLLSAELALLQATSDELNGLVALSQALGGGWTAP
jgi:multidrug efflux system outer membrane protein